MLVLIAMIAPAGNIIKTSLQGTVQIFSTSINSQTNDMDKQLQEAFNNAVANLSHINTPYVKGDFSTKGNLVTINGTRYRVAMFLKRVSKGITGCMKWAWVLILENHQNS